MTIKLINGSIYKGKRKIADVYRGKWGWYIYDHLEGYSNGPYLTIAEGIKRLYHIMPEQAVSFPELSNRPGGWL